MSISKGRRDGVIVRSDGLGVPQTAHSALAGRLAEAWVIDDDLPAQDLRVAAAIHDIGWTEWEQSPAVDPATGLPYAFHELPSEQHAAIWTAGTDAAATFGRWVALLVSLHCTRLMGWRQRSGNAGPEIDALVEREVARQRVLRTGLDDDVVDRASGLIARWDGLSLDLCGGKEPAVSPWPFATYRLELHVDARELGAPHVPSGWHTLTFSLSR
jgi:hypothetical protein